MANRRLAAVPEQPEPAPAPDLRKAVTGALSAMPWLGKPDVALSALALRQAEEIEQAVTRAAQLAELRRDLAGDPVAYQRLRALEAMCDVAKVVALLGPQLQAALRDLGGTPAARKAMGADKQIGGRLASLRATAGNAPAARQDDT